MERETDPGWFGRSVFYFNKVWLTLSGSGLTKSMASRKTSKVVSALASRYSFRGKKQLSHTEDTVIEKSSKSVSSKTPVSSQNGPGRGKKRKSVEIKLEPETEVDAVTNQHLGQCTHPVNELTSTSEHLLLLFDNQLLSVNVNFSVFSISRYSTTRKRWDLSKSG